MNPDVRLLLLAAAKDPDLTLEDGITALLRVSIAHCVDNPTKVSLRDLGEVLQGASKGLEAGGSGDSRSILQEFQEFVGPAPKTESSGGD